MTREGQRMGQRCARVFAQHARQISPVNLHAPPDPAAVNLVNFVTSVRILPPDMQLSMHNIVLYAGGAVKFTPRRFHAVVLRFGDNSPAGNATALVFSTGKIVIVGAVNLEHARFASQHYRMFLEQIPTETHRNLEGLTRFDNFNMYNVVGQSTLGFRPSLQKLQKLYPGAADWEPELFPGLTLQVWPRKKSLCRCPKKKHKQNDSCACNATVLVFDTGNMVVTGVNNHTLAVAVCDCIRLFFADHRELQDTSEQLPRHLRFNHRRLQKLSEMEVDFLGTYKTGTNTSASTTESATSVLQRTVVTKRRKINAPLINAPEKTPIYDACHAGQLEMVNFLAALNPATLTDELRSFVRKNQAGHPPAVVETLLGAIST